MTKPSCHYASIQMYASPALPPPAPLRLPPTPIHPPRVPIMPISQHYADTALQQSTALPMHGYTSLLISSSTVPDLLAPTFGMNKESMTVVTACQGCSTKVMQHAAAVILRSVLAFYNGLLRLLFWLFCSGVPSCSAFLFWLSDFLLRFRFGVPGC